MGWMAAMASVALESPAMEKTPESASYWSLRHDMLLELASGSWRVTFITGSSLVFAEVADSAVSLRNSNSISHAPNKK